MELINTETAMKSLVDYFAKPPLNLSQDDSLFQAIRKEATIVEFKAGHVICKIGEKANLFWWLLAGQVDATIPDGSGGAIRVGRVSQGNLLGESTLFKGDEAFRNATLTAATECVLLQIPMQGNVNKALVKSRISHYVEEVQRQRLREQYSRVLMDEGARLALAAGYKAIVLKEDEIWTPSEQPQFVFILTGEVTRVREQGETLEVLNIEDNLSDRAMWDALANNPIDYSLVANSQAEILLIPVKDFYELINRSGKGNRIKAAIEHLKNLPKMAEGLRRSFNPFAWKTLLFLPQFAFEKAWQKDADCFIVDFQDAVPLPVKASVREGLKRALINGELGDRPIVVRINENAIADEQKLDLDTVVGLPGITALMPTMTERPEELDALHIQLLKREKALGLKEGSTKLLPLIETPGAILRVDALAQAGGGRIIGIFLGHGDLFRLTGAVPHGTTTMDYPRNAVLFAARANGIAAFDTPYTKVTDVVGLEREAREAKRHGFDGKACIHRDQLSVVKRCMLPTAEEIAWAVRVESARKEGLLDTLAKKLNERGKSEKANRQTDGMALVDGQLVGPPHIKAAQRILNLSNGWELPAVGRKGRLIHHRSDAAIQQGAVISNPYELTVTEGMLDLWLQSFYTHNPAHTSSSYANTLGTCKPGAMPVPFMMALYLCVSMSDTHGAIYHLGFRDAKYTLPIQTGDTLRQRITVVGVRNTADGKRAVVTTLRELINIDTQEVVFKTEKMELYAAQPESFGATDSTINFSAQDFGNSANLNSSALGWERAVAERAAWKGYSTSSVRVQKGEVILHSFARPLGVTANLALSTRFLVTHPIHLDHRRYDQGEGLGVVVSGGLVISLIVAAASRDFSHVIWEELLAANNVRTVSPNETVGAFSVVIDQQPYQGNEHLEVLVVKTIGVKNISPASDMDDLVIPEAMLKPLVGGGSKYDDLCKAYHLPALEGKIVGEVTRRIVREVPR
jgi:citrate lyase subunit beta/citryl-CoA lyase